MSNLLSQRREVGEFKKRYPWMALVVFAVFGLLGVRAVYLQVVRYDHYARIARDNITKEITRPATRGIVRDTAGRVIAENQPSYNVFITPQLIRGDEDIDRIAELMQLDAEARAQFRQRLAAVSEARRNHQIQMFSEVTREQLAALQTHQGELPGVDVVDTPVRTYPFGNLGAHALGYLNEISAEELKEVADQGYRPGDRIGRSGMERAWEGYLRGRSGYRRVVIDVRGQRFDDSLPPFAEEEREQEPLPGRDLTLTLDLELMRTIERAFRGHPSGAVVVVDVNSGRVRALFSKPSYDLNEMSGRLTSERYAELSENPFRPLIDKTVYETYFPGSTFKPISALAALGMEGYEASHRYDCPGYYEVGNRRFRCNAAHSDVDMRQALVQSCNVYFWKLAEQVGLERLNAYAGDFGLGERTGIGINSEASGFLASREWYERQGRRFMIGFTLNTAIGQGNTRVSLLQLAMSYAAIANGGTLYAPQLVERVQSPDGRVIEEFGPRVRRRVDVPPEDLAYVMDGLYGVVNDPTGTAYDARVEGGIRIAGKTGTAQVERRRPRAGEDQSRAWYFNRAHAWFAGFAPANDPEVAIVVLVEHGGGGGRYAAPIATQILEEYLGADAPAPAPGGTRTRGGR
jgi:penicillin-binding protein 2